MKGIGKLSLAVQTYACVSDDDRKIARKDIDKGGFVAIIWFDVLGYSVRP